MLAASSPRLVHTSRPSAHPASPVPYRDDSWFNACDQHRLRLDVSSFRSGSVLGNASAQEWGALGERIASHPNTERDELDRLQLRANAGQAVLARVPTPVPPPATLFFGIISGDVKRRRRLAPTPPSARHAAARRCAAPRRCRPLQPLPVRRATDHSVHLGARAATARACRDADLPHRAEAAGPLGGGRA